MFFLSVWSNTDLLDGKESLVLDSKNNTLYNTANEGYYNNTNSWLAPWAGG